MTAFAEVNETTQLGVDKVATSPVALALYRNLLAVLEQDPSAPFMLGNYSLLEEEVAAAAATVDLTTGIDSDHDHYMVEIINLLPATDGADLRSRVSTNGGSSFLNGASDYQWGVKGHSSLGADMDSSGAGLVSEMILTGSAAGSGMDNAAGAGLSGFVWFFAPSSASRRKRFLWDLSYESNEAGTTPHVRISGVGAYVGATTAINAVRFLANSGNISGTFRLWGHNKTGGV